MTVTIGVSPYHNGVSIQQMMEEADAKLYYGKRNGKNQVVSRLPEDTNDSDKGTKKEKEKAGNGLLAGLSLISHGI